MIRIRELHALNSATSSGISMADDEIERIVADSDDENQEGISMMKFSKVCGINCIISNSGEETSSYNDNSRHKQAKTVNDDQIYLASKSGKLVDEEAGISNRYSQNSCSNKFLGTVYRSRIRKLYKEATTNARDEALCDADRDIGSQEPNELSQAVAMDVVDKLLSDHDMGSCQDIDSGKAMGLNSPPTICVRGTQRLAQWADLKSSASKSRTFDWVESLAVDVTGNNPSDRMESFSESQGSAKRSHSQALNPMHLTSGTNTSLVDRSQKKENKGTRNFSTKCISSLETPILENMPESSFSDELHASETENLLKVDKQTMTEPSEQQAKADDVGFTEEVYDIGPNTQMAAEAMEALFYASPLSHETVGDINPTTINSGKDPNIGTQVNATFTNQCHVQVLKRASLGDLESNLICYKRRKSLSNELDKDSSSSSRRYCSDSRLRKKVEKVIERATLQRAKWEPGALLDGGDAVSDEYQNEGSSGDAVSDEDQNEGSKLLDCKSGKEVEKFGVSPNGRVFTTKRLLSRNLPFDSIAVAPRTRRYRNVRNFGWMKLFSGDRVSNPGDNMVDDKHVQNVSRSTCSKRKIDVKGLNQIKILDKQIGNHMAVKDFENQCNQDLKIIPLRKGASNPPKCRRGHLITAGKSNVGEKTKSSSPSIHTVPPSTGCGEREATVKCLHDILDAVIRKKRSIVVRKASSIFDVRRISLMSSSSGLFSKKDFKRCKPDLSEVGSTLLAHDSSVINHMRKTIEVPPGEKAAASVSNAQDTKANAGRLMVSSSNKSLDTRKISLRKPVQKLSITRELIRLDAFETAGNWLVKESRGRKVMSKVRVLFSSNLDEDVVKQQKKNLARFRAPIASSVTDATHFIADRFARTKNMLEAMALGKPVVTHQWLDNCARASYFVDEKNYLLRDPKKEKEIGFSMPVSIARARQHPLLQGRSVFITPNVKPNNEVVEGLVRATQGQIQTAESGCKPGEKNDKISDDNIVISCEEDYAACIPFLDRGVKVFSSELLLNGIIIQKLEFDRHQLFVNHVKRTCS